MSSVLDEHDIDLDRIDVDSLPTQIRRFEKAIGLEATLRLLQRRGGAALEVPLDGARSQLLINTMGRDAAIRFCATYGGQLLSLPKMDKVLVQLRNHLIRQLRAEEHSLRELARRFDLTTRHIINICRDEQALLDSRQIALFQ